MVNVVPLKRDFFVKKAHDTWIVVHHIVTLGEYNYFFTRDTVLFLVSVNVNVKILPINNVPA